MNPRTASIECDLRLIARSLGFDRERNRNIQRGFQSAAELGTFAETELDFRGEHYRLGERFDIVPKCNQRDVEENLRQIREARRQADFVIVSLHNQDTLGRRLADAQEGKAILDRIARLSKDLGTQIEQRDGRGIIRL